MDPLSPWLIVIVYAVDLLGLAKLGRAHGWRMRALSSIPLLFVIVYSWVGFSDPPIESVRYALRYILLFSGGVGGYVIFDFLLRGKSLNRRHDDR